MFLTSTMWTSLEQQQCHTLRTAQNPPPCPVKARKAFFKERRGCNTQEKRPELLVRPSTGRKVNCCLCWTVPLHPDKQGAVHFSCVHHLYVVLVFVVVQWSLQTPSHVSEPHIYPVYKAFKKKPPFCDREGRELQQLM